MKHLLSFTRRDFLKLSAAGALGLFLTETGIDRVLAAEALSANYGRILQNGLALYESPSFTSTMHKAYGKDQVVSISEVIKGEDNGNPYNNSWYRIGDEGYTYSGWLQPVETVYQKPVFQTREAGQLGEITVPYCISRLYPDVRAKNSYRLYYRSTHWVKRTVVNREQKGIWYEIYDFYLQRYSYVSSYEMRIIPDEEIAPLSPDVPESLKSIHVDLATQTVTAFEDDSPVLVARCATGAGSANTPLGDFLTYHKGPSIHMTNLGDVEFGAYDLPGVPWVSFFTGTGIAFHGTYWHNDYGRPRSNGCVNLRPEDSKFIYRWTRPVVPPEAEYLHLPGQGTAVRVTNDVA
jgi:lipoprotein-anchoring transpeptidase ErfK/SrfK